MSRGRGFGSMRSSSMDGCYGRIRPCKDLDIISELHATEVPSSNFGYERVSKPSIARRASFSWSRRSSKKHIEVDGFGDVATESQQAAAAAPFKVPAEVARTRTQKKKRSGIKKFLGSILESYKKIMQSAEDSNMQFSDLYPNNSMVAPVTPAASSRAIKYIAPSPGVGRNSLVRVAEESSRER